MTGAGDLMAREGRYRPHPTFPHIPGSDFAAEVGAIDERVGVPFRVGQRVTTWWAALASRLASPPSVIPTLTRAGTGAR